MEFCKITIIKEFDCTRFSEHGLYYIHWHDIASKPIKAIYLCDVVDEESNSIVLKRVASIQDYCSPYTIRLGSGNMNCIDEVQEVAMNVEHNAKWCVWKVGCEIQPNFM